MESTDKKVDVAKFSKENFAAAYSDVDARAGKQLNMRRLIFGVLLAAANGDTYDAKYASIAEKYVLRPEVGASTEATLNAQAKALLENAKRLIDEHGETRSGDLMWSDLEDAAIAFALAALAEKAAARVRSRWTEQPGWARKICGTCGKSCFLTFVVAERWWHGGRC